MTDKPILFLGLVPLAPGEAPDPNSPKAGFRCETEDEAIARIANTHSPYPPNPQLKLYQQALAYRRG
jgi:hypothetical protein